jgi:hypothetical protein
MIEHLVSAFNIDVLRPYSRSLLVGLFLVGGVLPGGGMMWLLRRALRKA